MKKHILYILFSFPFISSLVFANTPFSGPTLKLNDSLDWNEGLGYTYKISNNWFWNHEFGYIWADTNSEWIFVLNDSNWIWYSQDYSSLYYDLHSKSWRAFTHDTGKYLSLFSQYSDRLTFSGTELSLSPYLWRDFMPSLGTNDYGLMGNFSVNISGEPIQGLKINKIWVYHTSDEILLWEIDCRRINPPAIDELREYDSNIQQVARYGPKWDVGTEVSIAILVAVSNTEFQILHTDGIKIMRVE